MGGLTYGAVEAGSVGFGRPRVVVAFVLAIVGIAAFVRQPGSRPASDGPAAAVRNRTLRSSAVIGFAFMVGYYGLPFVFSLYFQQERGLSPLATGRLFLPMMLIGAALTPFSARLVERLGHRLPITAGLLLMAAGLGMLGVCRRPRRFGCCLC